MVSSNRWWPKKIRRKLQSNNEICTWNRFDVHDNKQTTLKVRIRWSGAVGEGWKEPENEEEKQMRVRTMEGNERRRVGYEHRSTVTFDSISGICVVCTINKNLSDEIFLIHRYIFPFCILSPPFAHVWRRFDVVLVARKLWRYFSTRTKMD